MFLYLFGENFSRDIILANYEFYEPKTGHGSSLSPSIHSLVAARLGKTDDAYKYFVKNARIDLDDQFGNSSGGIHIASQGGAWMSVVMGFAGMYPTDKGLIFDPHLPEAWENLEFSVKWLGLDLNIKLNKDEITFFLSESNNESSFATNKTIFVSLGQNNWKELNINTSYYGVQLSYNNWNWKD